MLKALCIIAGLICLIWGLVTSISWLIILGVILLTISGIWVFLIDGDFDSFD